MSPMRIFAGLVIAGLVLAAELVAYWHFGFAAKWVPIVLLLGASLHRHSLAAALSKFTEG